MGHLAPKYIVRYQKGSDPPVFSTLEEHTKEAPWVDIWIIRIWGQDNILEAGEDLLTPNNIPSQIPTNLEEVEKETVGAELTRKYMAKLWSSEEPLVREDMEILVWHHSLNH